MQVNEVNEDVIWLIVGCVEFLLVDLIRVSCGFDDFSCKKLEKICLTLFSYFSSLHPL